MIATTLDFDWAPSSFSYLTYENGPDSNHLCNNNACINSSLHLLKWYVEPVLPIILWITYYYLMEISDSTTIMAVNHFFSTFVALIQKLE